MATLVVCGPIGAGKSRAVKAFAEKGYAVVSFSRLVRKECAQRDFLITRENCQRVGQELFESLGPEGIVAAAMAAAGVTGFDKIIFDGVRHSSVLDVIERRASHVVTVYVDSPQRVRYERYKKREGLSRLSLNDFRAIDEHPIEAGTQTLIKRANVIIDNATSETDFEVALQNIAMQGSSDGATHSTHSN